MNKLNVKVVSYFVGWCSRWKNTVLRARERRSLKRPLKSHSRGSARTPVSPTAPKSGRSAGRSGLFVFSVCFSSFPSLGHASSVVRFPPSSSSSVRPSVRLTIRSSSSPLLPAVHAPVVHQFAMHLSICQDRKHLVVCVAFETRLFTLSASRTLVHLPPAPQLTTRSGPLGGLFCSLHF